MLHQLHWLLVEHQVKFKDFILISKVLCGLGLIYLQDRIPWYVNHTSLSLTDQDLLVIPGPKDVCLASAARVGLVKYSSY